MDAFAKVGNFYLQKKFIDNNERVNKMKSRRIAGVLIVMLLVICLISQHSATALAIDEDLGPIQSDKGKWRIAYCENDPYINYAGTLYGIARGLYEMGWINSIEEIPYQYGQEDAKVMWDWLTSRNMGEYIEFVEDAFYPMIDMTTEEKEKMMKRLNNKKDIDLVLVMGTVAGQYVAEGVDNIPSMIFSTSNAVRSKIIESVEDSGKDNLWAHMDTKVFIRQLDVFHDICTFDSIGIVYEDSELGYILSAVNDVHRHANECGIEVVEYHVIDAQSTKDMNRYDQELMEAYEKISKDVDAFYLTPGCREVLRTSEYLEPFYHKKIPVFAMAGTAEVEHGAMLTVFRFNFNEIGQYGADRVIRVLKGEKPRNLKQDFAETPSITINMAVAEKIGYKIPFNVLLSADQIITNIK